MNLPRPARATRRRIAAMWIPLTCLAAHATPVAGQAPAAALADTLWEAGDVQGSFEVLDGALAGSPEDYELLWRATRAATVMAVIHPDQREKWLRLAEPLSDRTLQADSMGLDGRHWRLYALGEAALKAGPRTAGRLGGLIRREATDLLARDSLDAYAHNALGRLSLEVMTLSRVERFFGKLVVGDALRDASWERALHHLTRAVELRPDLMGFRIGLGAYQARKGMGEEAKAEFRRALELAGDHPWEQALALEARKRLEDTLTWAPDP